MARDWEWHGDTLTGLPIALTASNIASASGTGDGTFADVFGSGVSVVSGGTRSPRFEFAKVANAACALRRTTHTVRTVGQETFYWTPPSTAPATGSGGFIYTVRNGTAVAFRVSFLVVSHAGAASDISFRLLDSANGVIGAANAAGVLFGAGPVRVEVDWACGTTSTGSITLKTFNGDTTTQLGTTVNSTTSNINTGYTQEIFGTETASADAYTFYIDDMMRGTARTDGGAYVPPVTGTAPVVTTTISSTTTGRKGGDTIQLVGTATGGTITAQNWRATPGHTATEAAFGTTVVAGATRDIVIPYSRQNVTYSFTYTATNATGSTTDVETVDTTSYPDDWMQVTVGGPFLPIMETTSTVTVEDPLPELTLGTVTNGDAQGSFTWSLALNNTYTSSRVTGVQWYKRRKADGTEEFTSVTQAGTVTGTGATAVRAGNITPTRLVNDVVYSVTVTPMIDGALEATLAQTVDLAPVAGGTVTDNTYRQRNMGFYWSSKQYSAVVADAGGGVHPDAWSDYIQPGMPGTSGRDPDCLTTSATQEPHNHATSVTHNNATCNWRQIGAPNYFTRGVGPAANDPGDPYTTAGAHPVSAMNITSANGTRRIGTYYRDLSAVSLETTGARTGHFKATHFQGWSQSLVDDSIDRKQAMIMTYAVWFTSSIKWIGLGVGGVDTTINGYTGNNGHPTVTQAQYDWACRWQDEWILWWKTNLYDKAPAGYPCWIVITHEPEVGPQPTYHSAPNWGTADAANPTNHPDAAKWFGIWFTRFFTKVREAAPRMKCALWIGGGRSDGFMDTILDNITVAPDLITVDTYVNGATWKSANTSWTGDINQFRAAPSGTGTVGRHNVNYIRLSKLARTNTDGTAKAVQSATGTAYDPIPMGITEHAMSHSVHTDQEIADYIEGTNHGTAPLSLRETMKALDLIMAVWWSAGSGPQGSHDIMEKNADGSYKFPLTLAAHKRELARTDVVG